MKWLRRFRARRWQSRLDDVTVLACQVEASRRSRNLYRPLLHPGHRP